MNTRFALVSLSITLASLCGCGSNDSPSGAATATAGASAPAKTAAPPASPAATASEAPKLDCPDPSMTKEKHPLHGEHCTSPGATRMMEAKWNGKSDDLLTFTITNKSPLYAGSGHAWIYAYDKTGKLLDWDTPFPDKRAVEISGSGLVGGGLKPGESKEVQLKSYPKDKIPAGAAAIEMEVDVVFWKDVTWRNQRLIVKDRPKGGVQ